MFEVEPTLMQFDASKARVKRGVGKVNYADVRVSVPLHAKSTDELPRTTSPMSVMRRLNNTQWGFGDFNVRWTNASSGKKRKNYVKQQGIKRNRTDKDLLRKWF